MPEYAMSLPSSLNVHETIKILADRRPVLEPMLRAFEPVFEAFGRLAGELAAPLAERGIAVPELDAEREAQGVSLLAGWDCAGLADAIAQSAKGILPFLSKTDALKKSADELEAFFAGKAGCAGERDEREKLAQAVLSGDDDAVVAVAERIGINAEVLKFAGEMCLSPVLRAMVDGNSVELRTSGGFASAANRSVRALRDRGTPAADRAAHEIENLLADTDLFEHYRMALLET